MTENNVSVPQESKGDIGHAIVRAGLSVIPAIGGPAVELFQYLVQPPLEKRRRDWMAQIGEKLRELESKGLRLDELQNNDQFISAAMHASQIALRTHQAAKRVALKNALSNVACGKAPDESLQNVFLNLVDTFTELHLRILKLFQAPTCPPNLGMGGLSDVLEESIPELRGQRELYDLIWRDLFSTGLVNTNGLHVTMTGHGLGQKRTTAIGDSFLRFIEE